MQNENFMKSNTTRQIVFLILFCFAPVSSSPLFLQLVQAQALLLYLVLFVTVILPITSISATRFRYAYRTHTLSLQGSVTPLRRADSSDIRAGVECRENYLEQGLAEHDTQK